MHPTQYKFAHHGLHPATGVRALLWASTVGDLVEQGLYAPVGSTLEADLLAEREWEPNDLVNEGEQDILAVYFRGATPSANLFFRLFNDTPVEADTLTDLTGEVTGTGYAAISLSRNTTDFPTLALDTGDFMVTSATKTFTAGGSWSVATHLVLGTTADNTGKFIAFRALSTPRTLVASDTLAVTFSLKLA